MAEPFYPAYAWSVWFGAFQPGCTSFEYNETHATFDVTTQKDGGASAVGIAEYTANVRFECPVKVSDEASYPKSGDRIYCQFISGTLTRVGYVAITSMSERLGGKGGKIRSYQGQFSGAVTGITAGATS